MQTLHDLGLQLPGIYRSLARDAGSCVTRPSLIADEVQHLIDTHTPTELAQKALITFPRIGKWFDGILSGKTFDRSVASQVGTIPFLDALFGGRFEVYAITHARHGFDPILVFLGRQFLYFAKKWEIDCPSAARSDAAHEFWAVDDALRTPRSIDNELFLHVCGGRFIDGLETYPPSGGCVSKDLRQAVAIMDLLSGVFTTWKGAPAVADLQPKHGPGAVSDLKRDGDKYTFPGLSEAIASRLPDSEFFYPNKGFFRQAASRPLSRSKTAAKLIAVPKTFSKPRLIASEPVVHQFFQQALMKWMRDNLHPILKRVVDFHDQEPSRQLALESSSHLRNCTIDLSAASDRLSLWAVESFFGKNPPLLDLLIATRSNAISDSITGKYQCGLRKFAPMGSATTFPVQSMIYATAAISAVVVARGWAGKPYKRLSRLITRSLDDIQVFGDDIIVPKEAWPILDEVLEFLELKVNHDKSHFDGHFRESCGMDAYRGQDVTPAYISHPSPLTKSRGRQKVPASPTAFAAYVEQSNNAHRKGLWHLSAYMVGQIPENLRENLPCSSESLGVCSLMTFSQGTLASKVRFKPDLQRHEVWGYKLRSRREIVKRDTYLDLLQYFIEGAGTELDHLSTIESLLRVGNVVGSRISMRCGWVDPRHNSLLKGSQQL